MRLQWWKRWYSSVWTILLNKRCKYQKLFLPYSLFPAIEETLTEKLPLAFCRGNKSDANFWVGLQKYVIPAALHCWHDGVHHQPLV